MHHSQVSDVLTHFLGGVVNHIIHVYLSTMTLSNVLPASVRVRFRVRVRVRLEGEG
jgi:hypothetical protein